MENILLLKKGEYVYCLNDEYYDAEFGEIYLRISNCGKWIISFKDKEFAQKACVNALKQEVVLEAKYVDQEKNCLSFFYINGKRYCEHKKVIEYFFENNLIPKTKNGKYYNLAFKYDRQTMLEEYGSDFKAQIKLEDIIDLYTGEWTESFLENIENEKKKKETEERSLKQISSGQPRNKGHSK